MTEKQAEALLMKIDKAFGLTKHDFKDGRVLYNVWGSNDLADLKDHSLKISKDLGDVYIDKIKTDEYIVVGTGTTLHCDDMTAGKEIVTDFEGFLM